MASTPDIGFWKLLGSGTGEGFTPRPNTAVYAILATWPDHATARKQIERAPVFTRYRARASESWTVFVEPYSVRGNWSGTTPMEPHGTAPSGPIAALTRATIRKSILHRFWGRVPAISDVIGADPNVMFKIGIGEAPWVQQVTFSIWPDVESMAAFARQDGPHARAIKAVRAEKWFREELYARFRIVGDIGTWDGVSPLSQTKTPSDRKSEDQAA